MILRLVGPVLLLALGLASGAQAASTGTTFSAPLPSKALPVPPVPPATPPLQLRQGYDPAPVPDLDVQRPQADRLAEQPHTEVVPSLFDSKARRQGDGYVPGSARQYDANTRLRPSPGINLRVPLQ